MTVTVEGNVLHIAIPLQTPTPSASGKTLVVASTHGNLRTTVLVQGKPLTVGLNAFTPR